MTVVTLYPTCCIMASFEQQHPEGAGFLIAGDCNAHTKTIADWVENDTDSEENFILLPNFYESDQALKINERSNKDKKDICQNGSMLISFCKTTGVKILNGRVGLDKDIGEYTYYDRHGGSVVDFSIYFPYLRCICY